MVKSSLDSMDIPMGYSRQNLPILNLEIQGTPVAQRDLDLSRLDLSLRFFRVHRQNGVKN